MPLQRFQNLDDDRKAAILAAAEAEFSEHGFSKASYNAIIKAAGLSKGAMYYYFADKADLCQTVLERALGELLGGIEGIGSFGDPEEFWAEVHALCARGIEAMEATPRGAKLWRLIYDEASVGSVLGDLVIRVEAWVAELLVRGQGVSAVRTDVPLGFLATSVTGLFVYADRWVSRHYETLPQEELERLVTVCLGMVRAVASPR